MKARKWIWLLGKKKVKEFIIILGIIKLKINKNLFISLGMKRLIKNNQLYWKNSSIIKFLNKLIWQGIQQGPIMYSIGKKESLIMVKDENE